MPLLDFSRWASERPALNSLLFSARTRLQPMTPNRFIAVTYDSCLGAKPAASGLARFSFAGALFSAGRGELSAIAAVFNSTFAQKAAARNEALSHSRRHGSFATQRSEARTRPALAVLQLPRKTGQKIFANDFT